MRTTIFPGKGAGPGFSLCAVPFLPGWSSKGSADFRSTKIVVRTPSLEKISEKLTKKVFKKVGFHDLISIAAVVWLKNANRPKIGFDKCEKSRKIVVPEPLVF